MTTADAAGAGPAGRGTADQAAPAPGPVVPDEPRWRSERTEFWKRTQRGWDLAFYALSAITAAALLTQERATTTELVWGTATVVGLVAAYVAVGRRAARTGDRVLVAVYLTVLVVAALVLTVTNDVGSLLLFVAYSQVWYFAESRRAGVVVSVVLTIGVFGAIALREGITDARDMGVLATQGGVSLAFAVLLGLWITYVAEQSEQRALLLEQLEEAQAQLAHVHHAAGVVAERERMAREIHDTLAQGFTSVVMLTQTAVADIRRDDPDAAVARLELAERTARDNLAEARALVAAFSPVALDGVTVAGALERLARRFEAETGVTVEVVLPDDELPVSREAEVVLLRAAQEALTNVRRHAQAERVRLRLTTVPDDGAAARREPPAGTDDAADVRRGGTVELEVVDDGRGIATGASEGYGLSGMRARVSAGGGEVSVRNPAEGGTAVTVRVPGAVRGGP
ncbi:sensor histidine kinase [Actinotalea sp. Marseille-Q4924]|uniref:sensor histidine kinase n=1 Tax=Actinotalea sp. Marseille-Q4924 TaxID=2866571 RepID=UPI001CE45901|nr:sensor histidine kinase [Actinotalea sp. Marseille-Q4924]